MFTRRFTGPFLLCLMLAPGCISQDRHVFPSTVFQPATVSVRDIVSQKLLWKKDIPVGYELVLNFQGRHEITGVSVSRLPAKRMKWHIRKINSIYKIVERGRMDLSGMPVGIAWSQRPGPEAPPDELALVDEPQATFLVPDADTDMPPPGENGPIEPAEQVDPIDEAEPNIVDEPS